MEDKVLIPRRRVLGLGMALAGLCAGCAVLPGGSADSAVCRREQLPGLRADRKPHRITISSYACRCRLRRLRFRLAAGDC